MNSIAAGLHNVGGQGHYNSILACQFVFCNSWQCILLDIAYSCTPATTHAFLASLVHVYMCHGRSQIQSWSDKKWEHINTLQWTSYQQYLHVLVGQPNSSKPSSIAGKLTTAHDCNCQNQQKLVYANLATMLAHNIILCNANLTTYSLLLYISLMHSELQKKTNWQAKIDL